MVTQYFILVNEMYCNRINTISGVAVSFYSNLIIYLIDLSIINNSNKLKIHKFKEIIIIIYNK